jgi:hypothetical protein
MKPKVAFVFGRERLALVAGEWHFSGPLQRSDSLRVCSASWDKQKGNALLGNTRTSSYPTHAAENVPSLCSDGIIRNLFEIPSVHPENAKIVGMPPRNTPDK